MTAATALLVAFGAVSAGASECSNSTFIVAMQQSGDAALDSKGNVWFTTNIENSSVWSCPKDLSHQCREMGGGIWGQPQGIAADNYGDFPSVFVAEYSDAHGKPKVKQCTWNDHVPFACTDFGSGWNLPHDVVVDKNGSIFILDLSGAEGSVWKCSRAAVCTMVGDISGAYGLDRLAVDSQGTIYVTRIYRDTWSVSRCTSTGNCSNFYSGSNIVGRHVSSVAVGPDDSVYLSFSVPDSPDELLVRCPPDHEWDEWRPDHDCETVGAFGSEHWRGYVGVGNMVIDEDGAFYTAGGGLRRICVSPAMQDIQV